MSTKLLTAALGLVVAILALNSQTWACTSMARPTVLDAFENANLVITARLASVDKVREKEREYDIEYIRLVTMIVDKVYKGDVKPGAALKFAQGGGADCVWTYDEAWIGEKFLFYLGKPTIGSPFGEGMGSATVFRKEGEEKMEPMYHPITCGRSRDLDHAADDLSYLANDAQTLWRNSHQFNR